MSHTHYPMSSVTRTVSELKRCVECRTPVPIKCSPGVCDTCNDIRLGQKIQCKCGNKIFQSYRPTTMPQQSCIMCMVRGITSAKSDKQKKMIAEYTICSNGCGMPHRMKTPCRYCVALCYNPYLITTNSAKSIIVDSSSKPIVDLSTFTHSTLSDVKTSDIVPTEVVSIQKIPVIPSLSTGKIFTVDTITDDTVTKLRKSVGASCGESFVIIFIDSSDKRSVNDVIRVIQKI